MKDKGHVSIDFLMSIIIFMFAILLLVSQIPMLFAPLQSTVTDIQPVAYCTSMLLVDDGGLFFYNNTTTNRTVLGSRWDLARNINHIVRIGLAASMPARSSSEDVVPLVLSQNKIDKFNNFSLDNITVWLGLNVIYQHGSINYSFNTSIVGFDGILVRNDTSPLLQVGNPIPESGVSVEKIERIIVIDNATKLSNTAQIGNQNNTARLVVYIWR
jgi:hypothetical protein